VKEQPHPRSRGNDVMDGGGGTDAAPCFDSFEVVVDLVGGTATEERGSGTLANLENVIGSAYADTILGDDGPNAIWAPREPTRSSVPAGTTY
jgi:serralysin